MTSSLHSTLLFHFVSLLLPSYLFIYLNEVFPFLCKWRRKEVVAAEPPHLLKLVFPVTWFEHGYVRHRRAEIDETQKSKSHDCQGDKHDRLRFHCRLQICGVGHNRATKSVLLSSSGLEDRGGGGGGG